MFELVIDWHCVRISSAYEICKQEVFPLLGSETLAQIVCRRHIYIIVAFMLNGGPNFSQIILMLRVGLLRLDLERDFAVS
jgi:hypothetical protein